MLSKDDIKGVMAMVPTPCVSGGEHWSVTNSVDLPESARMAEQLCRSGVGALALLGTTGECAALLWEEKQQFVKTVVETVKSRVPVIAGATALGTKETILQMRTLRDIGADGAFVGLPLWQQPTLESSIRWYEELSKAVPDMPIMVYSNDMFFKSKFPTEFWVGVADRAPTVITCKIVSKVIMDNIEEIIERTGDRISYLVKDQFAANLYSRVGNKISGLWSTDSGMGPEPAVALADAMLRGDLDGMRAVTADLEALPKLPGGAAGPESVFATINAQVNIIQARNGDFMKTGFARSPYSESDVPDDWQKAAIARAKAYSLLRKKYKKG